MIPSIFLSSFLSLKKKHEKTVQEKNFTIKVCNSKGIANYFNMRILRQYI